MSRPCINFTSYVLQYDVYETVVVNSSQGLLGCDAV